MFELTEPDLHPVRPLLPADSRRGKPWRDHRQVLGGILWKLHTGQPWRDVPARLARGRPATVSRAAVGGRDPVQDLGAAGRRRPVGLTRRSPAQVRSAGAGGGAGGCTWRGPDSGDATMTTQGTCRTLACRPARPGWCGRVEAGVVGQFPVGQPPARQHPEPVAGPSGSAERDPGPPAVRTV
jgi:transposase